MYRKNHPQFKLIFFVMDESSGYIEKLQTHNKKSYAKNNNMVSGKPHLYFFDIDFLKSLEGADIDYLVWFSPFKLLISEFHILALPKACIFEIKALDFEKNIMKNK